jgi:hypothetical protein
MRDPDLENIIRGLKERIREGRFPGLRPDFENARKKASRLRRKESAKEKKKDESLDEFQETLHGHLEKSLVSARDYLRMVGLWNIKQQLEDVLHGDSQIVDELMNDWRPIYVKNLCRESLFEDFKKDRQKKVWPKEHQEMFLYIVLSNMKTNKMTEQEALLENLASTISFVDKIYLDKAEAGSLRLKIIKDFLEYARKKDDWVLWNLPLVYVFRDLYQNVWINYGLRNDWNEFLDEAVLHFNPEFKGKLGKDYRKSIEEKTLLRLDAHLDGRESAMSKEGSIS